MAAVPFALPWTQSRRSSDFQWFGMHMTPMPAYASAVWHLSSAPASLRMVEERFFTILFILAK